MSVPHTSREPGGGGGDKHIFKIEYSVVDDRANKSPIFVVKSLVYLHFIVVKVRISSISHLSKMTECSPGQ